MLHLSYFTIFCVCTSSITIACVTISPLSWLTILITPHLGRFVHCGLWRTLINVLCTVFPPVKSSFHSFGTNHPIKISAGKRKLRDFSCLVLYFIGSYQQSTQHIARPVSNSSQNPSITILSSSFQCTIILKCSQNNYQCVLTLSTPCDPARHLNISLCCTNHSQLACVCLLSSQK